jgi:hypothetical protein
MCCLHTVLQQQINWELSTIVVMATDTKIVKCSTIVLVSNQFSPGTSSLHRMYSCCVIVSTADFIYAFNSTRAWPLTYLATCMHTLHAWWRELVPAENLSLASRRFSLYHIVLENWPVLPAMTYAPRALLCLFGMPWTYIIYHMIIWDYNLSILWTYHWVIGSPRYKCVINHYDQEYMTGE